jgi:CheY-like chemotaxis protein/HPt (histidine-containing phosphotransfer) domain-containing protein
VTALRVLHVDDEPDIREVVDISLGLDPKFETRGCGSGHEAIALAMDWPPDIILLDVMMPGMDGPATLARLRENAKTANIPVVFMTARAQTRELDLFRSLGAVGVIPKPFDPMTLAASVRAYIQPANDRFGTLQGVFLKRVGDDTAALLKHRSALKDSKAAAVHLARIKDIAHGLAGAGGIFGFSEISAAATSLEEAIMLNGSGSLEDIAHALDRLLICIETSCTHRMHSVIDA